MQALHLAYQHWFLSTIMIGSATRGIAIVFAALRGNYPGNSESFQKYITDLTKLAKNR